MKKLVGLDLHSQCEFQQICWFHENGFLVTRNKRCNLHQIIWRNVIVVEAYIKVNQYGVILSLEMFSFFLPLSFNNLNINNKMCFHFLSSQEDVVLDPMSGNPLKIKKLIDVHFTPIKDDDKKKSLITKDVSFCFCTFWQQKWSKFHRKLFLRSTAIYKNQMCNRNGKGHWRNISRTNWTTYELFNWLLEANWIIQVFWERYSFSPNKRFSMPPQLYQKPSLT